MRLPARAPNNEADDETTSPACEIPGIFRNPWDLTKQNPAFNAAHRCLSIETISMPTYDYVCKHCDHRWELFQSIKANPVRKCPECGKLRAKRLISAGAGILFKGSGFYQTDYRSDSYKKAAEADKKSREPSDSKSESKSDSSSKTETKSSSDSKSSE